MSAGVAEEEDEDVRAAFEGVAGDGFGVGVEGGPLWSEPWVPFDGAEGIWGRVFAEIWGRDRGFAPCRAAAGGVDDWLETGEDGEVAVGLGGDVAEPVEGLDGFGAFAGFPEDP